MNNSTTPAEAVSGSGIQPGNPNFLCEQAELPGCGTTFDLCEAASSLIVGQLPLFKWPGTVGKAFLNSGVGKPARKALEGPDASLCKIVIKP